MIFKVFIFLNLSLNLIKNVFSWSYFNFSSRFVTTMIFFSNYNHLIVQKYFWSFLQNLMKFFVWGGIFFQYLRHQKNIQNVIAFYHIAVNEEKCNVQYIFRFNFTKICHCLRQILLKVSPYKRNPLYFHGHLRTKLIKKSYGLIF